MVIFYTVQYELSSDALLLFFQNFCREKTSIFYKPLLLNCYSWYFLWPIRKGL